MDAQIAKPADPEFMMVITIMLSSAMWDGLIRSTSRFFRAWYEHNKSNTHGCVRELRVPILFQPYPPDLMYQILILFNLALTPFSSLLKSDVTDIDLEVSDCINRNVRGGTYGNTHSFLQVKMVLRKQ
jgi:hypothetical protein